MRMQQRPPQLTGAIALCKRTCWLLLVAVLALGGCTGTDESANEEEGVADVAAGETADSESAENDSTSGQAGSVWGDRGREAAEEPVALPEFSAGVLNVLASADSARRCSVGMQEALSVLGADVNEVDTAGDPARMADGMDVLLGEGHDVIFGLSVEPANIAQQLQQAQNSDVPFINFCGAVRTDATVAASVVPVDWAQSALAGQYMIDSFKEENPDNPQGKIALLEFPPLQSLFQRATMIEVMFEEFENIEIAARHEVDFARAEDDIRGAVLDILTADPEIDFVYGLGDFMLAPVVSAIEELGMSDQVGVIAAQSGSPAILTLIEEGRVDAVGDFAHDASAWIAVDLYVNALARDRDIRNLDWQHYQEFFNYSLITSENVDASYELASDLVVQQPSADHVAFFTAKWTEEFGL